MPSFYVIQTGELFDPDGALLGIGYAGHPPFVNQILAVNKRNQGPLPPGQYRMQPPIDDPHTVGPLAIALEPLPDSDPNPYGWLYGRSGFYVHADLAEWKQHPEQASDGCIVMTHLPDGTVNGRAVREKLAAIRLTDPLLRVVLTPDDLKRLT